MKTKPSVIPTLATVTLLSMAGLASAQQKVDVPSRGPAVPPAIRASENTVVNYIGAVPPPVQGALDADDSLYNRLVNCSTLSGVGTAVFYDTISIINNSGSTATFVAETSDQGNPGVCSTIDTFLTAYRPSFNPASPLTNCVVTDDDTGPGLCSRLTFTVPAAETAVIVVTSFSNGATFPYQVNFAGTTELDPVFKDGFDALLGCNPVAVAGSVTLSDPTQNARLFRDGVPDTCASPGTCGTPLSGAFHYRQHRFRNYAGAACVNVTVDTACTGTNFVYAGAYIGGFDPTAVCTNNVASVGSSPNPTASMSFDVPAATDFDVVVSEVTANAGCPAYTLTVTGCSAAPKVLFDSGPLITHVGGGAGGAHASRLQNTSLSMATLGYTAAVSGAFSLADQFTVPAGPGWSLRQITFFGYQTGSTTTSTFNDVRVQIWNGPPNAGGSVIWGDLSTNRLASTSFSNIYRDTETTVGNSLRPIMKVVAAVNFSLAPGTYWVEWKAGGTLVSGPFFPPLTILGQTTTGSALQFGGSSWTAVTDVGTQGFKFVIEGF